MKFGKEGVHFEDVVSVYYVCSSNRGSVWDWKQVLDRSEGDPTKMHESVVPLWTASKNDPRRALRCHTPRCKGLLFVDKGYVGGKLKYSPLQPVVIMSIAHQIARMYSRSFMHTTSLSNKQMMDLSNIHATGAIQHTKTW